MKLIVAVDKNWGIGKGQQASCKYPGGYENVPPGDNRKSGRPGKKNSGHFSGRPSLKKQNEYHTYRK